MWNENPEERPNFSKIKEVLRKAAGGKLVCLWPLLNNSEQL